MFFTHPHMAFISIQSLSAAKHAFNYSCWYRPRNSRRTSAYGDLCATPHTGPTASCLLAQSVAGTCIEHTPTCFVDRSRTIRCCQPYIITNKCFGNVVIDFHLNRLYKRRNPIACAARHHSAIENSSRKICAAMKLKCIHDKLDPLNGCLNQRFGSESRSRVYQYLLMRL